MPTLNVNPTLFVIPCKNFGHSRFTVLQLLSLTKWFCIQISIIHDNISSQVAHKEKVGFLGQWMNSSIIHDTNCSLIHKKCHLKSYHSDIDYHMALNIIFSVLHKFCNSWDKYLLGAWLLSCTMHSIQISRYS